MPAQPRRLSLRLPHWSWLLVATGILIVGAVGVGAASYIYGQWTARKTIERVGGWIATEANCPEWLRAWCQDSEGNSPFDDIVGAYLNSERVTDSDLKPLWVLSRLKTLDLSGNQITDEGLRSIAGLSQLDRKSVV